MDNDYASELKIGMCTDSSNSLNGSFLFSTWEGLKKAKEHLGIKYTVMEAKNDLDYKPMLDWFSNKDYRLVFAVGFMMTKSLKEISHKYRDTNFVIIDDYFQDMPSNVTAITFKEQDGSFLVGYIAGKMSKTGKVGFIGGFDIELINKFQYGFMAGVKSANPDVEIIVKIAKSFNNEYAGKFIAKDLYEHGCDILYHAAGNVGRGIIEYAKENDKMVIGVDSDQNFLAPNNVITSMIKKVDDAIFDTIKDFINGEFTSGQVLKYGLNKSLIDIAPTSNKNVSKDILDKVEELKQDIVHDKITPPVNKKEYERFLSNKGIEIKETERKKKVLFLCTHNAARSQMAEGFIRHYYGDIYEPYSAGINKREVNPYVIQTMDEIGIDISNQYSKEVGLFTDQSFDYVVTVCDSAKENCPAFTGNIDRMMHHSFKDPSSVEGTEEEKMEFVRKIRDEIKEWIDETFGNNY
jgi:basic membrane protein A